MRTSKPLKTHFLDVFFGPKRKFFSLNMPFLLLQHVALLIVWLFCEFEGHRSHTVKNQSVLVQTLKPQKNRLPLPFFQPKTQFFFLIKVASFLFQNLLHPIGWLPCDFERPYSNTVKIRIVLVRTWIPQNTTFLHFLAQNPTLAAESSLFRFWYTLYAKVGSYPVNLSLTGAIQRNSEMFSWSFPENPGKPVF